MDDILTKDSLGAVRHEIDDQIAQTLIANPHLTYPHVANMFHVSREWICKAARKHGIRRPAGRKPRNLGGK